MWFFRCIVASTLLAVTCEQVCARTIPSSAISVDAVAPALGAHHISTSQTLSHITHLVKKETIEAIHSIADAATRTFLNHGTEKQDTVVDQDEDGEEVKKVPAVGRREPQRLSSLQEPEEEEEAAEDNSTLTGEEEEPIRLHPRLIKVAPGQSPVGIDNGTPTLLAMIFIVLTVYCLFAVISWEEPA